ncbi:MAG: cytochrome D ubiquinol oxidase subunit I, partial [Acidobacteriota bacterium]
MSESLDPHDWSAFRALGHRMLDDMVDHMQQIGARPAWRGVPPETRDALRHPMPREGTDLAAVYDDFRRHVLP